MGAVGGLLGLGGGASGSGYAGPRMAPITNPVTSAQLAGANTGVQGSLTGQNNLLAALQNQNGLGNQNQVYGQLQNIVNGTGPNPAQAMLNQSTGQNVANQAALMAGQRGSGANVGLLARQAGQVGANAQQQAAGQASTLQANQSLGALGQAGALANSQVANQIGQTNANNAAAQAQQNALLNAQQGYNTNVTQGQGNVNAGNVNLANTTMGGQQAGIGGLFNSAGGISGLFGNSGGENVDGELNAMADEGDFANGGMVKMADGGSAFSSSQPQSEFGQFLNQPPPATSQSEQMPDPDSAYNKSGGKSSGLGMPQISGQQLGQAGNMVGNALSDSGSWLNDAFTNLGEWIGGGASEAAPEIVGGIGALGEGAGTAVVGGAADAGPAAVLAAAGGGQVKAMVSPGEIWLNPQAVERVRAGANPMKVGQEIPGKPKVGGAKNSYANDTVRRNLDSGGIVVPRSETKSKNPERNSAEFVAKVLAKRKV